MEKFNENKFKNKEDYAELNILLAEAKYFKRLAFWGLFICTG
jgi:hypothetical protein